MTKWTAITVIAILAALAGLIAWLRYEFNPTLAASGLLLLFGVAAIVIGWMLSLASQRATLNAIVDFQAADDRGEVARANMWREFIRGQGKVATIEARQAPQLEALDAWTVPPPSRQIAQHDADDVAWS